MKTKPLQTDSYRKFDKNLQNDDNLSIFILKNDGNVIDVLCNILRIVQPNSHESRSMRMK